MPKATSRERARVLQKAQGTQKSEQGKITADRVKIFKDETLALYRAAWMRDPAVLSEDQASDPGRLACVLAFLKTLAWEVMENESSPFQRDDHPRMRLAWEAYRLLEDIKDDKRTLLDDYFAGAGKRGRPSYRIDKHIAAILTACVVRLEEVSDRNIDRADIYNWMRGSSAMAPHMADDPNLNVMYGEQIKDTKGQFGHYLRLYKNENHTDAATIIERASHDVDLRGAPLSMEWATKVSIHGSVYTDSKGNRLAISPEQKRQMLGYPALPNGAGR